MIRRIDREKIERADRESKLVLDAERQARQAKTCRLRQQRILQVAGTIPIVREESPPAPRPQKRRRKIIEID